MPRRTAQQLLILAFLCTLTFTQQQDAIAFLHVHVVPMDRERILDDQTVVIRNGHIAAIGPTRTVTLPVRTQKIDATGRYLVPASPTFTSTSTRPSNFRSTSPTA